VRVRVPRVSRCLTPRLPCAMATTLQACSRALDPAIQASCVACKVRTSPLSHAGFWLVSQDNGSSRYYCRTCSSGNNIVPAGAGGAHAPAPTASSAFPAHDIPAPTPSMAPAGVIYPPITEAFSTNTCGTVFRPDAQGDYNLNEQATIGPDGEEAMCDCESKRAGNGCEAVDGGRLAEILDEMLQASLPHSGDTEFSCEGQYPVCVYGSSSRITCHSAVRATVSCCSVC
jgi:hypothetical protein